MKFVVQQSISVNCPAIAAAGILQDIASLACYEPRIDALIVYSVSPHKGEFIAKGRLAGLPWRGVFSYALHRFGFNSEMKSGPRGLKMQGSTVIQPHTPNSCSITHYERYEISGWLALMAPLLRWLMAESSKKETQNLALHIEKTLKHKPFPKQEMPQPYFSGLGTVPPIMRDNSASTSPRQDCRRSRSNNSDCIAPVSLE